MSKDNNLNNDICEIESLMKLNKTYKNKMELQQADLLVNREIITSLKEEKEFNSNKISELELKNSVYQFKINRYKNIHENDKNIINYLYKGYIGLILFYSYILFIGYWRIFVCV